MEFHEQRRNPSRPLFSRARACPCPPALLRDRVGVLLGPLKAIVGSEGENYVPPQVAVGDTKGRKGRHSAANLVSNVPYCLARGIMAFFVGQKGVGRQQRVYPQKKISWAICVMS